MKILVVDDERVLVKGIKFNLESEGYQVEVGYDGEQAVELARSRAGMSHQKEEVRLTIGHITLDADARAAWKEGQSVDLTAKEFDLMELLMRNPGRVYSRENLLNVVWGYEYAGDYRTVDVHVRRLREKLELDPANPRYILTKWGVGYYLKNG